MPTLDASAADGYGVCDPCRDTVAPHRWNRFAAGLPDDIADHIVDALVRPRRALLRASFGDVPWGGLGAVAVAGCVGAAWVLLQLVSPDLPGGARFGKGFLGAWEPAGAAVVFLLTMHALQPQGDGPSAPVRRSMAIVVTAGVPLALTAAAAGVVGFGVPLFVPAPWPGVLAGGAVALAALWSAGLAGRGLALRRAASTPVALASAASALVITGLVVALLVWLRFAPKPQGLTM